MTATGQPVPDDVPPPDLLPQALPVWRAFHDLHTCRSVGFGAGPIPWTAIDQYGRRHGLGGDDALTLFDFEIFERLIWLLDARWLDAQPKPA